MVTRTTPSRLRQPPRPQPVCSRFPPDAGEPVWVAGYPVLLCPPAPQTPLPAADSAPPPLWAHVGGKQSSGLALLFSGWGGLKPHRGAGRFCRAVKGAVSQDPWRALGHLCSSQHEQARRRILSPGMAISGCTGASGWGRARPRWGSLALAQLSVSPQATDNWLPEEGDEVPGALGRTWCWVRWSQCWGRTGSPLGALPHTCCWGQGMPRGACGSSMSSTGAPPFLSLWPYPTVKAMPFLNSFGLECARLCHAHSMFPLDVRVLAQTKLTATPVQPPELSWGPSLRDLSALTLPWLPREGGVHGATC
ncbi:uncharacterized protein LOC119467618 [Cebus imitator]|uniref:uncharacterized protein LOC119467618 n=1 Tax=Cebus imitator TaxID=2715852 RepID=UPI00189BD9A1|nr:uncharacterized protein LOC119467618 [Cebus imitator]